MSLAFSTIRNTIYSLGGVIRPGGAAEEVLMDRDGRTPRTGKPASDPEYIPVAPPQFGLNLASFGAITSKTFLIGELGHAGLLIPFHYCSIAGIILHREDGRLRQALRPLQEEYLLIPQVKLHDKEAFDALAEYNLPFIDTEAKSDSFDSMRQAALATSYKTAQVLFARLVLTWRERFGGEGQVLAIHGTLDDIDDSVWGSDLIAISDASPVLATETEIYAGNLSAGEMTQPFILDDGRRYFYLRVRDNTLRDPAHGLVRVEFMPFDGIGDTEYARALAFYVLNERIPINPASQGPNQIFPLAACMDYLQGFTTSSQTVNAYFGRRD